MEERRGRWLSMESEVSEVEVQRGTMIVPCRALYPQMSTPWMGVEHMDYSHN